MMVMEIVYISKFKQKANKYIIIFLKFIVLSCRSFRVDFLWIVGTCHPSMIFSCRSSDLSFFPSAFYLSSGGKISLDPTWLD